MKERSRHIIKTQSVEISFEELEDSIGIQNRVAEVFYEKVQPAMNALFDEVTGEKSGMTIDRLEIDSGILSKKNWEEEWVDNTIRKLKEELITKTSQPLKEKFVNYEGATDHFFFFLEHGYLPWNCRFGSLMEIEEQVILNTGIVQRLKEFVVTASHVAERLVYSFSQQFRDWLIKQFIGGGMPVSGEVYAVLYSQAQFNNPAFQIAVLQVLASGTKNKDAVRILEKVQQISRPAVSHPHQKKKEDKLKSRLQELQEIKDPESIFIENAGLVILHPFLTQLFQATALIKHNHWSHETAQHIAVNVLEYLVTGKDEAEEFSLPLNKILCGMNTADIVQVVQLDKAVKQECENLLVNVIKYWTVLKNTGTDALREIFLQRNGKLSGMDNGLLLQVEPKPFDILLGSLPWGIGTIKLPWMEDILYTEWVC